MFVEDDSGELFFRRIYLLISKNWCEWQSLCALLGLSCGLLSIIAGGLLWAVVHYVQQGRLGASLNMIEVACFALSLPLLVLGAYCLDLLEQRPPALTSPTREKSAHYVCQLSVHPKLPPGK
ncbi:MAG TPA: hypothetical protein VJS44_19005 [Pyrinomonadaceae bacterium]|nr:hypothetical protein [Pyrinomonadaceae bacterium]